MRRPLGAEPGRARDQGAALHACAVVNGTSSGPGPSGPCAYSQLSCVKRVWISGSSQDRLLHAMPNTCVKPRRPSPCVDGVHLQNGTPGPMRSQTRSQPRCAVCLSTASQSIPLTGAGVCVSQYVWSAGSRLTPHLTFLFRLLAQRQGWLGAVLRASIVTSLVWANRVWQV